MVKDQRKGSWDESSLSVSDSEGSMSGSSSENTSRSEHHESSSDSSEPSSAKNKKPKSFSDKSFGDIGADDDLDNERQESDRHSFSNRPSADDGENSNAESEDISPDINNGAFKWPGQVRKSQRISNDVENQKMAEDSPRGIKERTVTDESSEESDSDKPGDIDGKPVEERPTLLTRERKIITCLTLFLICMCLLATLGIGIAIGLASARKDSPSPAVAPSPTPAPTRGQTPPTGAPVTLPPSSEPSINTLTPEDTLLELLIANSFDDGAALLAMGTPQRSAYEWLSNNTNITDYSDEVKLARYALATFYYSTNGPTAWDEEIRNDAWVTDAPECEWATTASNQCSDNVYTSLTLDFVGVSGQIPEELALLTGLTRLSLRSEGIGMPSISGSLPESIGLLGNLETIRLNENNIGGTLPTTIGLLSNIRVFLLSGNSIEGSIPSEIGQTGGNTFNFDRNELSGKLPTELFTMETLTALNFEENSLSGTIPTEIGLNPSLNSVNLASNSLTGTIPSEIGNLVTAKAGINVSNNELSGSLPSEIGFLVDLQNFLVNKNQLVGTVPTQYSTLSDMRLFRIDGNLFSGSLPQDVCDSFTTRTVSYSDCATTSFSCECCTYCCTGDLCTCNTDDETVCTELERGKEEGQALYLSESKVSTGNKRDTSRRR